MYPAALLLSSSAASHSCTFCPLLSICDVSLRKSIKFDKRKFANTNVGHHCNETCSYMFEKFKIQYLGRQPTAQISDKALDRIILREYKDDFKEVKQKLELIRSDTKQGKNRLSAAVLKLSNGDLKKIDSYVKICNNDFRDVLSYAEYPRVSKYGFGEIPSDKLKKIYLDDWSEYSNWVNKN